MVPHTRALIAVALAARCSGDEQNLRSALCSHLRIQFPADLFGQRAFWQVEGIDKLPIEVSTALETSQMALSGDYTPMFTAAEILGVSGYLTLGGSTIPTISDVQPFVSVPQEIVEWRQHSAIRMALECMLLCGLPVDLICSDMRKMYGRTFEESYVQTFKFLFADRAKLRDWTAYSRCIPQEELSFKHRLMAEPADFVRWKLGVPVNLDSDTVLDRLMSDAYFTERLLKHEARGTDPHGLPALGTADLARIKMERDTIFKCMDRKLKMREIAGQQSTDVSQIHQQIAQIKMEYSTQTVPLVDELKDG